MSDISALLVERAGYVVRGRMDRVAQVDAVLATFGVAVGDDEPDEVVDEVETTDVETDVDEVETTEAEPDVDEVETTEAEPDVDIETPETKPARNRRS